METKYTWMLLAGLLALTVAIDVYLALDPVKANTFSAVLRRLGNHWPFTRLLVTFGIGVIVGHLYW